ncbi:MAG TPA: family 1 glycosylhydrolase [Solirubrobacteraceae bacterium]|nr:family 1 glycosylhydrolase [Solirubrobacteraceae bacterium]
MSVCVMLVFAAGSAAALARPQYRGAQVHSLWSSVSNAEMAQELNALQSAGANVVRVDVGWATLETAKGRYDSTYLAKLDAFVNGAQARGIKVIATLWQTPRWASSAGAWNDPPANPADYGDFARFITARYGTELAAVEAWNEPEINDNLLSSNLPATYTQMVKAFYVGAKEGNSSVDVLAGSLAYADMPFLQALYANGINGFYDGISMHPYADGANPDNTSVTHSFLGGIQTLHAAQQAAGDDTPIWVTEFGWPTGTSSGANSEQQQAEYIEEAFGILDGLPYVKGATVYELRDMGSEPANPEDNFGLVRQNFTPRAAYTAFTAAMQAPPGRIPGTPTPFQGPPESSTGSGSGTGSTGSGSTGSGSEVGTTPGTGSGSGSSGSGSSGAGSGSTGSGATGSGSGSTSGGTGSGSSGSSGFGSFSTGSGSTGFGTTRSSGGKGSSGGSGSSHPHRRHGLTARRRSAESKALAHSARTRRPTVKRRHKHHGPQR